MLPLLFAMTFADMTSARVLRVDRGDPSAFGTITAACAAVVDGDTIRIARGTYVGGEGGEATFIELSGVTVVIQSDTETPEDVVLEDVKLHFRDHASVDLRYLAWRATTNTAVSVVNSTASVVRCVFANITSAGGSGISADQSDVLVTDCTFRDCSTPYRAGAILGSTFSIERCEFTGNSAGESGGAIHGVGRISHCLFVGNRAHSGAAVALSTD
ncbi:MAG: hypothetical protein IT349_02735, partial [Candidatus Eisenbacteria bacterium]|nr:hypothetical protein [Candidatus Eisenbacteria bacterium]